MGGAGVGAGAANDTPATVSTGMGMQRNHAEKTNSIGVPTTKTESTRH